MMKRLDHSKTAIISIVLGTTLMSFSPRGSAAEELWGNTAVCGNGICEDGENHRRCARDCCSDVYSRLEQLCMRKGWEKITVHVSGLPRKLLWKKPEGIWRHGAIIVLHGGGGAYSNFCGDVRLNKPMGEFCELAIQQGFAVFSLDSTYNLATDPQGRPVGKRWDSLAKAGGQNIDLSFIQKVITQTIPELRPAKSAENIFLTGISNGGFMTSLAATNFDDKITAFAPVSAGDPYGTYFDMGTKPPFERHCAPGMWRDNGTDLTIDKTGSCLAGGVQGEKRWATARPQTKPAFKQFHHQEDGGCDISCMEKARRLLIAHGYRDDGPMIIKGSGKKSILNHFWHRAYNQPLVEFFKRQASVRGSTNNTE